jgi:hypothetical protein
MKWHNHDYKKIRLTNTTILGTKLPICRIRPSSECHHRSYTKQQIMSAKAMLTKEHTPLLPDPTIDGHIKDFPEWQATCFIVIKIHMKANFWRSGARPIVGRLGMDLHWPRSPPYIYLFVRRCMRYYICESWHCVNTPYIVEFYCPTHMVFTLLIGRFSTLKSYCSYVFGLIVSLLFSCRDFNTTRRTSHE